MGPFKQFINRTAAKAILKKVTKIAARGEKTIENLNQLGLTNYEYSADGAFSMTLKEKNISQPIRDFVSKMKKSSLIKVGIAPSSVVLQYCQRLKIPYLDLITNLISKNENKYCFILFPYCARQKSHKPKNNDRQAIKDLSSKLAPSENILLLDNEFSAEDLRFLIQNLDILISSRYHALVCALSQEVVPLVIGWSHKYTETLRLFSLQDLAIDYAHLKKNLLEEKFTTIVSDINGYKNTIRAHLTKVKESSKVNFTIIKELLEN
ncbi:MAG: hypothetical protein GY858_01030 [Candidatus Omnitrophica bacterium]|nr:hypothetical protein [Candidatus Omnitrophota bacterium]